VLLQYVNASVRGSELKLLRDIFEVYKLFLVIFNAVRMPCYATLFLQLVQHPSTNIKLNETIFESLLVSDGL
jgi:hypothetical protein